MLGIPRRYAHYIFAVIQSGMTAGIAAAVASRHFLEEGDFLSHWLVSWLSAWAIMIPVVLTVAPVIKALVVALTREDNSTAK